MSLVRKSLRIAEVAISRTPKSSSFEAWQSNFLYQNLEGKRRPGIDIKINLCLFILTILFLFKQAQQHLQKAVALGASQAANAAVFKSKMLFFSLICCIYIHDEGQWLVMMLLGIVFVAI